MADQPRPPKVEGEERKPGTFAPGPDPRRGRNGGRPRKLAEIEAMLDDEHRTPEQMRETFALIRQIAHGVDEPVFYKGVQTATKRVYDGAWMALYLDRVLGPVKDLAPDLADAPPDVLAWLAEHLN